MKKLNYEEVMKGMKDNIPNNCITIGYCHPETFEALFTANEKSQIINENFQFSSIDIIEKNHILLVSFKNEKPDAGDLPYIETAIIPLA